MTTKRTRLTRDIIMGKALELIEKDGLENFSTRALGRSLGVQAMALYHHVPNKEALLDGVTARLASMIVIRQTGSGWRADLQAVAHSYMEIARKNPRAFPLLAERRFNSAETLPVLEAIFSIFRRAGLPPHGIASAFRLMGYFMNGAGLAEVATRQAANRPDFQLSDPVFAADYPVASDVLPQLSGEHLGAIFDRGLKVILDSIENDPSRSIPEVC